MIKKQGTIKKSAGAGYHRHAHEDYPSITVPGLVDPLPSSQAVFTQQRSTSATLHACATQPRGV